MKTKYFLMIGMFVLLIGGVFAFNFSHKKNTNEVSFIDSKLAQQIVHNGNGIVVENPIFKKPEMFFVLDKEVVGNQLKVTLYNSIMQRKEVLFLS